MNPNREKEKKILHECLVLDNKEVLVKEYGGLIQAIVRKTLMFSGIPLNQEDIDDIRIEVFIRLFSNNCRKLRQFNPEKLNLAGWIKLIANQTTIDEIRKKDPHAISKQRENIKIDDVLHVLHHDYEACYDAKEKLKIVVKVMEEMSPNDKNVLKMFYFKQFSISEVAAAIGKSTKTTQAVKNRAVNRLRKKIDDKMLL